MKKILLALLVLVLIVGAGVGGYFIGKSGNEDEGDPNVETKITEAQVVERLDDFYNALNVSQSANAETNAEIKLVEVTQKELASNASSSNHAELWESDEISYSGVSGKYDKQAVAGFILMAKSFLSTKDISEQNFYISSVNFKRLPQEGVLTATMKCCYRIENGMAEIRFDLENGINYSLVVDVLPNNNGDYVMNFFLDKVENSGKPIAGRELLSFVMDATTEKIYQYTTLVMETESSDKESGWVSQNFEDFSNVQFEDVYQLQFYRCDINEDYRIWLYKEDLASENVFTFAVLKNILVTAEDKTVYVEFSDSQEDYIEITFLKDVYQALGYEVVE